MSVYCRRRKQGIQKHTVYGIVFPTIFYLNLHFLFISSIRRVKIRLFKTGTTEVLKQFSQYLKQLCSFHIFAVRQRFFA